VIDLSENERDYSDYRQVIGNLSNIVVLLSGFTFTAITILLSQFSVLGSLTTQFILFFLAFLFFLFIMLMGTVHVLLSKFCRNFPPVTKDIAGFNRLMILSWVLLQFAVVLMFLIWNLVYLSLASGVMLAIFNIPQIRGVMRTRRLSTEGEGKTQNHFVDS
jgi:hypothetical protein